MPEFRFNGLGSGLDVQQIVEVIRDAEVAPANARLNRLEKSTNEEISALGQLQSSIKRFMDVAEGLDDPDLYASRKVELKSNGFFSAKAKEGAQLGRYDIAVEQLASATKIATAATTADSALGAGQLTLSVGDEKSLELSVGDEANTLADIRDAINDHEDNDFVTAAIIQDNDGARLILTSTVTGEGQDIAVSVSDVAVDSDLAQLAFDAENPGAGKILEQGQDAKFTVDGLSVTRSSNVIYDVIEGVSLTLKSPPDDGETPESIELSVVDDRDKVYSKIEGMVNAYNDLRSFLKRQTNVVQVEGGENVTGALLGDSTVRGLERSINRIFQSSLGEQGGSLNSLIDLGIERNGESGSRDKLLLDEDRVKNALKENFSEIGNLFVGDKGLMGQLNQQVGYLTETGGLLEQRTNGLQDTRKSIDAEREAVQIRREQIESRLYAQYQAMDRQVAQYSNTLNFIQTAFAPQRNNN